jgi:uncharacterized SAM-binding protein YcdF (DUF218 family)
MRVVKRNRRHPRRSGVWALLVGAIFLCVAALFWWEPILSFIGSLLIDSETPETADLILVLGGDFWGPRVLKGAELGKAGYAPLVLISGPPYQGRPEGEFAIPFLEAKGYSRKMFAVFAHNAPSTWREAIAVRQELLRRRAKRVLLVTSAHHSMRAYLVFRLLCPGVDFISVPAPDPAYHAEHWWSDESSRRLFFSEWSKIIGSLLLAPRIVIALP